MARDYATALDDVVVPDAHAVIDLAIARSQLHALDRPVEAQSAILAPNSMISGMALPSMNPSHHCITASLSFPS
jgi:hypothetical protein